MFVYNCMVCTHKKPLSAIIENAYFRACKLLNTVCRKQKLMLNKLNVLNTLTRPLHNDYLL